MHDKTKGINGYEGGKKSLLSNVPFAWKASKMETYVGLFPNATMSECVVSWLLDNNTCPMWTRIFQVHPHLNGETRFSFICEKLIFRKRLGVTTYFNFF